MLAYLLAEMGALVLLQVSVVRLKLMPAVAVVALNQLEAQTLVEQAAQTLEMVAQKLVERWVMQLLQLPILAVVAVVVVQLLVMAAQV
jgi:hydroxymethylpyrimidine/phosphomethylpyrimidine kinase